MNKRTETPFSQCPESIFSSVLHISFLSYNDLFTRTNDVSTLEFTIGFSVGGKSSFPDSFNFQPGLVYVLILASI